MPPLCIYHAHCADGAAAALVVRRALGHEVEFLAASYGEDPPDVTGRDVVMVDFSYKRPVIDAMADAARSVLILDHHKTAQAELDGIPAPEPPFDACNAWESHTYSPFKDYQCAPANPRAIFDMDRAGCQIAWDFFFPGTPRPALIDYVADRDLGRFDLPNSREINACLAARGFDSDTIDAFETRMELPTAFLDGRADLVREGAAILRMHDRNVAAVTDQTMRMMVIGGHWVPVVNCPRFMASDAAGKLAEGNPFAAAYFDAADGTRRFSLRSRGPDGADVAAIAGGYGGGGHRNAAGFEAPKGWEGDE